MVRRPALFPDVFPNTEGLRSAACRGQLGELALRADGSAHADGAGGGTGVSAGARRRPEGQGHRSARGSDSGRRHYHDARRQRRDPFVRDRRQRSVSRRRSSAGTLLRSL